MKGLRPSDNGGMRRLRFLALALSAIGSAAFAQDRTGAVQVRVRTDHADWLYTPGQPVRFTIGVYRDGHLARGAQVSWRAGPEMVAHTVEGSATLGDAEIAVDGRTMNEGGFLRCIATAVVDGKTYRGLATAAFAPETIRPTVDDPADFDVFWQGVKDRLAKLPIDAKVTPLPDYGSAKSACSHVNAQNIGTSPGASRLYGILCEPRAEGKYPALLYVPGAGVRPYRGALEMADRGIITLQIGIHGIPVTMEPGVYDSLGAGALSSYSTHGLDHRDRYYFKRVYAGCVRANDFLVSRPAWNGRDLAVTGGSQGGALSIVTAGLDPRVKGLAALYPALSDTTGYLKNRAGGWPHMFRATGAESHRSAEKTATIGYYDVVNFARRVKAPGLYTWGFNDETCPPTSMYSAYNSIAAPKRLLLALETGHNNVPEQIERINRWLESLLKSGKGEY